MARGRSVCLAFVVGACLVGRVAMADEPTLTRAREAYDQGAKFYEAKDFSRAAESFARADELAPDPRALRFALAAALQSDDALLGATLAQRGDTREGDAELAQLVRDAHVKFDGRVGRVRVICMAGSSCNASVEGRSVAGGSIALVAPGSVAIDFGRRRVVLQAVAGRVADAIEPPADLASEKPVPPPRPIERRAALPAWVFWTGVVTTGVLAGVSTASALDTKAKRDDFLDRRDADTRDSAQSSALRSNVLFAATSVVAIGTVIAYFFTRPDGER